MSLRAAYGKQVLGDHVRRLLELRHGGGFSLPSRDEGSSLGHSGFHAIPGGQPSKDARIAIIGAGAAGLYAAILLVEAGYHNVQIYEATSKHGGRCYTYTFKSGGPCDHNYYDVGAMRIPCIATMKSTFDVINMLQDKYGITVPLVDYTYDAGNEPSMYAYGQLKPDAPASVNFGKYMQSLIGAWGADFDVEFWKFIKSETHPDRYSTRAYLMHQANPLWQYVDTETAETLNTSSGLFDQAFMETVCDTYDFTLAKKQPWKRVDGGMSVLTDALYQVVQKLGVKVNFNMPVTSLAAAGDNINLTWAGSPKSLQYDTVFNTTTFAALQHMDLSGMNLPVPALTSIRALGYDRATKVAIKFKTAWWKQLIPNGGVSGTDLPISNVVYPTWQDEGPCVIIISYSWAQDATRMASLIAQNDKESTDVDDPVAQMCLRNVAQLWNGQTSTPMPYEFLKDQYIAHHAFGWSHDRHTGGGFALFGPGQFEYLYPQFQRPIDPGNKLWICGEAVSTHHAWISGAFDSALAAVTGWMHGNNDVDGKTRLKESPMIGEGPGKLNEEIDERLLYLNVELAMGLKV